MVSQPYIHQLSWNSFAHVFKILAIKVLHNISPAGRSRLFLPPPRHWRRAQRTRWEKYGADWHKENVVRIYEQNLRTKIWQNNHILLMRYKGKIHISLLFPHFITFPTFHYFSHFSSICDTFCANALYCVAKN